MRSSSRLFQVVLFVFTMFVMATGFAPQAEAGVFDFFNDRNSVEKNTQRSIDAFLKSEQEGTTSNEVLTDNIITNIQTTGILSILGPGDENSVVMKDLSEDEKRLVYEKYGNGAISELGGAVAMMYYQPASLQTYTADLLKDAHIIPQAQAQGLGFASLDPILETWKIFRNLAYLFFVVIFLVIGFMIMFRQKINGQTVVTAQQAIPKIIVSLIAVTFSYAIAGFLIDLMYILMFLMISVFNPGEGTGILNKSFWGIGWGLMTGGGGVNSSAFTTMNAAVQQFADSIIGDNAASAVVGWLSGLTMGLIVSIAILIGVFKMLFELLKTYITIIMLIATAPLILMFNALPGQDSFGSWVKNVFGNLLSFPVVLFALILYEMFTSTNLEAGGFVPPFMISRQQGSAGALMSLVGIGIILIIPDLIKEMKKALKVEEGIWGALAGKAVDQFKEGAPIGTKIAGGGLGATIGGAWGLGHGIVRSRGAGTTWKRVKQVARSTGRHASNVGTRGAGYGNKFSNLIGGKTPQQLEFVEKGVDTAFSHFSDEAQIAREEKGQDWLNQSYGQQGGYEKRLERAKKKGKQLQKEEYGDTKPKSTKKVKTLEDSP